ncbi:hypothetical protein [Cellulomonas sp. KRMCY2]|uniref:hypothetical protein n=1 Tax=Cellulomonas sp. KRMCY2 TaxID=1304865 RepID=UPI00045EC067|nr:hypothetical protein [Cellulomonas sp. KRMCY2]
MRKPRADEPKPIRLLDEHPATDYNRLIIRYPYRTDSDYAFAYHEAAKRLAASFRGEAIDDTILIPYLMLYRHAFELQLKSMVRQLAAWRRYYEREYGVEVNAASVEERLKASHGHVLHKVLNELQKHYSAIEPSQPFPESVERLILAFHEADKSGMAFRYTGYLPDTQERVDFHHLREHLDDQFDLLRVVLDPIEAGYDAMPDPDEYM